MPLLAEARPPSGEADTFEDALTAFNEPFVTWHAGFDPEKWQRNLQYKRP